ncbi:MAG: RNA recognition motif domain-containing protein [Alkalispirochaetaceae bacterium]
MATKLYVGNLNYQTQEEDLRSLFAQYGDIASLNIVMDRDTGRSRGFGFVEYADDEAAKAAESALNGAELDGRNLRVNEARPREESRRPRNRY